MQLLFADGQNQVIKVVNCLQEGHRPDQPVLVLISWHQLAKLQFDYSCLDYSCSWMTLHHCRIFWELIPACETHYPLAYLLACSAAAWLPALTHYLTRPTHRLLAGRTDKRKYFYSQGLFTVFTLPANAK
ncbi:hypothetical protein J6590_047446 [Homalodisca vitripennis]|nr:hypothetical protein J6590_047446 [Homalodisca vitripennis]